MSKLLLNKIKVYDSSRRPGEENTVLRTRKIFIMGQFFIEKKLSLLTTFIFPNLWYFKLSIFFYLQKHYYGSIQLGKNSLSLNLPSSIEKVYFLSNKGNFLLDGIRCLQLDLRFLVSILASFQLGLTYELLLAFQIVLFHFLQKNFEKISVICFVTCKRNYFKSSFWIMFWFQELPVFTHIVKVLERNKQELQQCD